MYRIIEICEIFQSLSICLFTFILNNNCVFICVSDTVSLELTSVVYISSYTVIKHETIIQSMLCL